MKDKYLGIDFGLKRVGLAVSDEGKTISFPRDTIANDNNLMKNILGICKTDNISKIIIGLPRKLNLEDTHVTEAVKNFSLELGTFLIGKHSEVEIEFFDERFTSSLAQSYIVQSVSGKKKRKDKSLTDSIAAQIILQDFLDREKNFSN